MNLYDLISCTNYILFESFKSDLMGAYNKNGVQVDGNQKLLTAVQIFNGDNLIKDKVKRDLKNPPNIAIALVKSFPNPQDLVNYINKVQQGFVEKEQQNKEKKQRKEQAERVSDDFFVYPCHTFEEAHSTAFSHTGSLERLSNQKIKKKYKINVPKPATHYRTRKTPAEFLEFMKSAPFFMNPSWCVTANQKYWDLYSLSTEKNEHPKCYIIISKQHPNVRFCITLDEKYEKVVKMDIDSVTATKTTRACEIRDPWQIGGGKCIETGKEMIKLAFNKSKIIENIISEREENSNTKFKDLINGESLFKERLDITQWTVDLPNLKKGYFMFNNCSNLTSFNANLPNLLNGSCMFSCTLLKSFSGDLPKLTNGDEMFYHCEHLTSFTGDLSNLTTAKQMFRDCSKLTTFNANLPNLSDGYFMFCRSRALTSWTIDLPNLKNGSYMFCDCSNLTSFFGDLRKLTDGMFMFHKCNLDAESVLRILKSIPTYTSGFHGLDIGNNTNFLNSSKVASLLGKKAPIVANDYKYKGWTIRVTS